MSNQTSPNPSFNTRAAFALLSLPFLLLVMAVCLPLLLLSLTVHRIGNFIIDFSDFLWDTATLINESIQKLRDLLVRSFVPNHPRYLRVFIRQEEPNIGASASDVGGFKDEDEYIASKQPGCKEDPQNC